MTLSLTFMVKVDGVTRKPTYDFLLVNNSKYMPICIATQNMHDLQFDLSRSLKVKVDGADRKTTYDFLLMNNSKYMSICSILRDITSQNMHDLKFGPSSVHQCKAIITCMSNTKSHIQY